MRTAKASEGITPITRSIALCSGWAIAEICRERLRLNAGARALRSVIGPRIRLKRTPTLRFVRDESIERAVRIEQVIAELAETLPAPTEPATTGHRFAFAGVAASGDGTLSERYKAIRRDEFGS